ncbi:MAG: ATP-grasp domain-containing protein [Bacillota bacterium]
METSSLLFWWPRVRDVAVPKPKTVAVWAGWHTLAGLLDGKPLPEEVRVLVEAAAAHLGYPLFLRTDLASCKHEWSRTCYVQSPENLWRNLYRVVDGNGVYDLACEAIVLRQYIPLQHAFHAFWGMPVARERRYFVRDGEVVCHHPYWPEESIRFFRIEEPPEWRDALRALNEEPPDEVELLSGYARELARVLPGAWSLDFALGEDGRWYFIDAAEASRSWHPTCPACARLTAESSRATS